MVFNDTKDAAILPTGTLVVILPGGKEVAIESVQGSPKLSHAISDTEFFKWNCIKKSDYVDLDLGDNKIKHIIAEKVKEGDVIIKIYKEMPNKPIKKDVGSCICS